MNKKEVIKKIEKEKSPFNSWEDLNRNNALDVALDIVEKLDEPEKPVVPQFVADFYEENKDDLEYNLYKLCIDFREQKLRADLYGWFNENNNKCIETLVKMKLFGYEIEEKKKYRVILKRNSETPEYLVDTEIVGFVFYSNIYTYKWKHTRKELEDNGFGWVFDCEDVEVEEVEE